LEVKASVTVKNTGSLVGSEVVQLYVTLPTTSHLTHAPLQLKAFAKVRDLAPGASQKVDLTLDKYATSYWDENLDRWIVERGEYAVRVGTSSDRLDLQGSFIVEKGYEWNGL
jgi:beta-glucosidase